MWSWPVGNINNYNQYCFRTILGMNRSPFNDAMASQLCKKTVRKRSSSAREACYILLRTSPIIYLLGFLVHIYFSPHLSPDILSRGHPGLPLVCHMFGGPLSAPKRKEITKKSSMGIFFFPWFSGGCCGKLCFNGNQIFLNVTNIYFFQFTFNLNKLHLIFFKIENNR